MRGKVALEGPRGAPTGRGGRSGAGLGGTPRGGDGAKGGGLRGASGGSSAAAPPALAAVYRASPGRGQTGRTKAASSSGPAAFRFRSARDPHSRPRRRPGRTMPSRGRLPLPPLLLVLVGSVLGNEGGSAGSCWCPKKYAEAPPVVRNWPDRLQSWEICGDFVRFQFPKWMFCGLKDALWVIEFQNSMADRRKGAARAEASEGGPPPTPRPPVLTLPAQTSRGPGGPATEETPARPTASEAFTTAAAQRPTATSTEVARVRPSHSPHQGLPAQTTQIAVIGLLGVTLLSIAVAVGVVCRRKRQAGRTRVAALLLPGAADTLSDQNSEAKGCFQFSKENMTG
uniref:C-X-C motif chemokine 16 n=1 Tax=Pogona vitticeps TaxID=103695 RepID=A0ABM5EJU6_9SAUR